MNAPRAGTDIFLFLQIGDLSRTTHMLEERKSVSFWKHSDKPRASVRRLCPHCIYQDMFWLILKNVIHFLQNRANLSLLGLSTISLLCGWVHSQVSVALFCFIVTSAGQMQGIHPWKVNSWDHTEMTGLNYKQNQVLSILPLTYLSTPLPALHPELHCSGPFPGTTCLDNCPDWSNGL